MVKGKRLESSISYTPVEMPSFDLLQPRRDALQAEYNLLSEKLPKLRRSYAIEAGVSMQFQLEKEIEQVEAELDRVVSSRIWSGCRGMGDCIRRC